MDAVFYITFYPTNAPGHHAAFYVNQLPTHWKTIEEHLATRAEQFEEHYGEPDWSSSQNPNSFGCICYNVESEMREQLVHIWQQIFLEAWPTCVVGPMCTVDAHTMTITDILQITKDAYEHQQAQLLRTTLNQQVTDSGCVGATKKM